MYYIIYYFSIYNRRILRTLSRTRRFLALRFYRKTSILVQANIWRQVAHNFSLCFCRFGIHWWFSPFASCWRSFSWLCFWFSDFLWFLNQHQTVSEVKFFTWAGFSSSEFGFVNPTSASSSCLWPAALSSSIFPRSSSKRAAVSSPPFPFATGLLLVIPRLSESFCLFVESFDLSSQKILHWTPALFIRKFHFGGFSCSLSILSKCV